LALFERKDQAYQRSMRTQTSTRNRRGIALGAAVTATALMMSGCLLPFGGSGSSSPSGALTGINEVGPAVVRIVAEGSYVDPAEGLISSAGSGSGFIIDSEGHVVTNAHVVEGAGLIRVYVGDASPVTARILGVSECNDLAVLDLEGDGYPYLTWFEDQVAPGLEVYVAGFPLGDPEFTLTRGILSKARADGATPWSSMEYSLEHDAAIQPGNSGGPLLTSQGRVVGVNYASSSPTNTSQYFAIPGAIAQGVVATLMEGSDVESLGINGVALFDDDNDIGGLWVSGVRAGSAASNAGIEAGDIVLNLAGRDVVTAEDQATKRGYCDVLRTQGVDSPMAITVYRPTTGTYLKGEINNPNKPLTEVGTQRPSDTDNNQERTVPNGYRVVTDSTGRLSTVMPEGWSDFSQGRITTDVGVASGMALSGDNDNFLEGNRSAAGVLLIVFEDLKKDDLLEVRNFLARQVGLQESCTDAGGINKPTEDQTRYEKVVFVDRQYTNCTSQGAKGYVASLWFPDSQVLVGYVATFNNDRQAKIEQTILFNIDVE